MIKRTLYFGNPSYLSIKNAQLTVRLSEMKQLFLFFCNYSTFKGFEPLKG